MKNFKKNKNRGFTLIELLVVIAIIGMLSATILTSLSAARAKGRDAKRIADMQSLVLALEMYADSNKGACPAQATAPVNGIIGVGNLIKTQGFVNNIPVDPYSNPYAYTCAVGKYTLKASLEGKSPVLDSDCDFVTACGTTIACDDDPGSYVFGMSNDNNLCK